MIRKWFPKGKEQWFLLALLVIAIFLRYYKLGELYTFLGDQGRDVLIARDIIRLKNFPFIGPIASAGDFYLGPFYYYFIAPALLLSFFDPIGPVIFVAFLGVVTCFLIYFVTKKFFGTGSAVITSLIYTISPLVVGQTRFSWNPNPIPFFTLSLFFLLMQFLVTKKRLYLRLAFGCLAILLQLHYLAFIMLPVVVIFLLFNRKKLKASDWFWGIGILIISFLPLIFFDLKHNFVNYRGLSAYFLQTIGARGGTQTIFINRMVSYFVDRFIILHQEFYHYPEKTIGLWILVTISIFSTIQLFVNYYRRRRSQDLWLLIWLMVGLFMFSFYQGTLHSYYLSIFLPLPALLAGSLLGPLVNDKNKIIAFIIVLLLLPSLFNMARQNYSYLKRKGNINIRAIRQTVLEIKQKSNGQPFNFSLLAEQNYDSSYRYFFDIYSLPAEYTTQVTNQLFVACEQLDSCHPEGNPKWEIALFDAHYNGQIVKTDEQLINNVIKLIRYEPANH
jgi:4-amino-4-deoxy-L-arabinose transferase-like glycosyltransferase